MPKDNEQKLIPENERYITFGGWPALASKAEKVKAFFMRPAFMAAAAVSVPFIAQDLSRDQYEKAAYHAGYALYGAVRIEAFYGFLSFSSKIGVKREACIDKRGGAQALGTALPESEFLGDKIKRAHYFYLAVDAFDLSTSAAKIGAVLSLASSVSHDDLYQVVGILGASVTDLQGCRRFQKVADGEYAIISEPPDHGHKQEDKVDVPGAAPENI